MHASTAVRATGEPAAAGVRVASLLESALGCGMIPHWVRRSAMGTRAAPFCATAAPKMADDLVARQGRTTVTGRLSVRKTTFPPRRAALDAWEQAVVAHERHGEDDGVQVGGAKEAGRHRSVGTRHSYVFFHSPRRYPDDAAARPRASRLSHSPLARDTCHISLSAVLTPRPPAPALAGRPSRIPVPYLPSQYARARRRLWVFERARAGDFKLDAEVRAEREETQHPHYLGAYAADCTHPPAHGAGM
ncbi:hypothetical protein C8J57DRAFT_1239606 [Mycena rebaudengoi]|nr:hypothetical protein C8J57DRAFT_1239606 [Mycena rebaudengoi]